MDKFNQQLIDVLMRARNVSSQSRKESKAASLCSSGVNAAQLIHNFITKGI